MELIELIIILILTGAGCGAGISVSVASGTASPLVIPLLTALIALPIHQAIGISLFVDSIIGITAGSLFYLKEHVDKLKIPLIAIPGGLGALMGSQLTTKASESSLLGIIGVILLLIGSNFAIFGIQKNIQMVNRRFSFTFFKNHEMIMMIFLGFALGIISGFLGIGVGAIVALILIFMFNRDIKVAIGTSLFVMAIITGFGVIGHGFEGVVLHWSVLPLGFGAVLGSVIGSTFANKIPEGLLGRVIGVIIIVFGMIMLLRLLV